MVLPLYTPASPSASGHGGKGAPRTALRVGLAVGWCALIWWLSGQPELPSVGPEVWGKDKLCHAVEYAVLGALSLPLTGRWTVPLCGLWGIADELHQRFVPGRTASPWDWGADLLGAWAGASLRRRRR